MDSAKALSHLTKKIVIADIEGQSDIIGNRGKTNGTNLQQDEMKVV